MATETGPDLTQAREAIEALQDDTCTIIRDSQSTSDDVLNETTGALVPPVGDRDTVYGPGVLGFEDRDLGARCKVSPQRNENPRRSTEGGVIYSPRWFDGSIPWDAPLPVEGDVLTVTSSRRDPELVGQQFFVRDVIKSTFLVSRRLVLERR